MAEIIQINNTTWRVEDGGVRFFLLAGAERALLIDSGMNTPNAKEIVERLQSCQLCSSIHMAIRIIFQGTAVLILLYVS